MKQHIFTHLFLVIALCAGFLAPAANAQAATEQEQAAQSSTVTAYDLIVATNTLRMSYGNAALIEDPIINAVAQATAQYMADNQMSWHIGNVPGRLASAGYGGGGKVFATENFAVGGSHTIDTIMLVWGDESHMIPVVNPAYCHVGAGVAKSSNGMTYYVLQAAYTSSKSCGEYRSSGGITNPPGGSTGPGTGIIVPVKIATPDTDGKTFHVVESGQSFWSIAIAYKVTIRDIEIWNNLSKDSKLQIGQRLFIPGKDTEGFATPTPVWMVEIATPEPDGKIVHEVRSYQTLSTISMAYGITVDTILGLNGLQVDWPLQIGQKLVIRPSQVTPSPTPRPLTPLEKLTPASDGKYYHTVRSGETLSWIADLYEVVLTDLMAWNSLNSASIIQPGQNILLEVTPPATATPTPAPATATPTTTNTAPPTATASNTAAAPTGSSTDATEAAPMEANTTGQPVLLVLGGLGVIGVFLIFFFSRKK